MGLNTVLLTFRETLRQASASDNRDTTCGKDSAVVQMDKEYHRMCRSPTAVRHTTTYSTPPKRHSQIQTCRFNRIVHLDKINKTLGIEDSNALDVCNLDKTSM